MTLMLLSMLYFFSRVANYVDLLSIQNGQIDAGVNGNLNHVLNKVKFENVQLLHIVTMVHSLTTIAISIFIWMMLSVSGMIDRRQYYLMVSLTISATCLYYFSIGYIIYVTGSSAQRSSNSNVLIHWLDSFLDVISSISNDVFSFLFALLMNFVLLIGIYLLNVVSLFLAELSKSIEHRRTGGRDMNELELNSFTVRTGGRKEDKVLHAKMPDNV